MADSESRFITGARQGLITALAAWISFDTSSLIGFREGYWAAISSIVVLQADLADTKNSGRDRFIGSAIGGLIGWGGAACWRQQAIPRDEPIWRIALFRFLEVSWGIAVALILVMVIARFEHRQRS